MARTAVVQNGIVTNIIKAPDGFALPGSTLVVSQSARIGDTYSNGAFATPSVVATVPEEVSDLQARLALASAGLLSAVDAVVAAGSDELKVWYDRALTWRRDSPHIAALAPTLGLTSAQVDALFIDAAGR